MRIGFTGTRRGMTPAQQLALTALLVTQVRAGPTSLHHGDCVGSDAQAHWIMRSLGGRVRPTVVIYPPLDDRLRAHCPGDQTRPPREYLDRNRDIVDDADVLVACPETESETWRSGTWSTVRYARRRGKRIVVIEPGGTAREEN